MIIAILVTVAVTSAVATIIIAVMDKIDTSPTQDEESRGGHDF
jgi:hypothetical protein